MYDIVIAHFAIVEPHHTRHDQDKDIQLAASQFHKKEKVEICYTNPTVETFRHQKQRPSRKQGKVKIENVDDHNFEAVLSFFILIVTILFSLYLCPDA